MPIAVISFKPPLDDGTLLVHIAISPTKARADAVLKGHAEVCPQYGPAFRANQTIEFAREVDSIPHFNGDDLDQWLDDLLSGVDAEEDDVIEIEPE